MPQNFHSKGIYLMGGKIKFLAAIQVRTYFTVCAFFLIKKV